MDLQDFWQENKRWVLGVVAGLIVYWIGSGVVAVVGAVAVVVKTARAGIRPATISKAIRATRVANRGTTRLMEQTRDHPE